MTSFGRVDRMPGARLRLGRLLATPGVLERVAGDAVLAALGRHVRGDWGDVCEEDAAANDRALEEGARVLSSYRDGAGVKFWVITEADRSSTTVLLPSEY